MLTSVAPAFSNSFLGGFEGLVHFAVAAVEHVDDTEPRSFNEAWAGDFSYWVSCVAATSPHHLVRADNCVEYQCLILDRCW